MIDLSRFKNTSTAMIDQIENKLTVLTGGRVWFENAYSKGNLYVFRCENACYFFDNKGDHIFTFNSTGCKIEVMFVNKSCVFAKAGEEGVLFNTISCKYKEFKGIVNKGVVTNSFLSLILNNKLYVFDDDMNVVIEDSNKCARLKLGSVDCLIDINTSLEYLIDSNYKYSRSYKQVGKNSKYYYGLRYKNLNIPFSNKYLSYLKSVNKFYGLELDILSIEDRKLLYTFSLGKDECEQIHEFTVVDDKYIYRKKNDYDHIFIKSLVGDITYDNIIIHMVYEYQGNNYNSKARDCTVVNVEIPCLQDYWTHISKNDVYFGDVYIAQDVRNNKWGLLDQNYNIIVPIVYDEVFPMSRKQCIFELRYGSQRDTYYKGKLIKDIKLDTLEFSRRCY